MIGRSIDTRDNREHTPEDSTFIMKLVHRDSSAWSLFMDRHLGIVWTVASRTCRQYRGTAPREDVEEMVQETLLRLLGNDCRLLKSFKPDLSSLRTWLAVVAKSAAVDWLRRQPRGSMVDSEILDSVPDERVGMPEPLFPDHRLSGRQNTVMHLLFDQDMSVAETARDLGVDEQTVRSLRHKALQRLRGPAEAAV